MKEIRVNLGERSYPIHIGFGSLNQLGTLIAERLDRNVPAIVITDENVARFYLEPAEASLRAAGFDPLNYIIHPGESSKTLETVSKVYDFLIRHRVPRGGVIIGLGGGVVGDIAAFVASTYKRGIPYVAVPTSLLAQVDSSVGGKTGVNHLGQKNVVGTFCQPRLVLIDVANLATLQDRQMLAGMAEVVKYGVVFDEDFFSYLEANYQSILQHRPEALLHIVAKCCQMKADVVAQDELDEARRHLLNYGHTVAHALEASTMFEDLLHGEAVSIGMIAAAKVSHALGRCPDNDVTRQETLLRRIGLPTTLDREFLPHLVDHLYADKKRITNTIRFVICEGIGAASVWPVTPEELAQRIASL